MTWEQWTISIGMPIAATIGVVLTMLTLPGIWFIVLCAFAVRLWLPGEITWWTLLAMVLVGVLAEAVEVGASALGASKAGASKRGAIGSILGAIVGALVGAPFLPPLGPIVGGALGAGTGAFIAERWVMGRTWKEAGKASGGAALGRLVATLTKCILAIVVGLIACVAMVH